MLHICFIVFPLSLPGKYSNFTFSWLTHFGTNCTAVSSVIFVELFEKFLLNYPPLQKSFSLYFTHLLWRYLDTDQAISRMHFQFTLLPWRHGTRVKSKKGCIESVHRSWDVIIFLLNYCANVSSGSNTRLQHMTNSSTDL